MSEKTRTFLSSFSLLKMSKNEWETNPYRTFFLGLSVHLLQSFDI